MAPVVLFRLHTQPGRALEAGQCLQIKNRQIMEPEINLVWTVSPPLHVLTFSMELTLGQPMSECETHKTLP